MRKDILKLTGLLLVAAICGCQSTTPTPPIDPQQKRMALLLKLPAVKSVDRWTLPHFIHADPNSGLVITTKNYQIFTTLDDTLILRQIPVFMESALRAYRKVLQQPMVLEKKLIVYMFGQRQQWEDFTKVWTGPQAALYLKIRAGAYYLNGACVAYHLNRQSDFSILAHEGWHQFSDVAFKYHLPAWLDEGLATQFESYQQPNGKITFKPSLNASRLASLRNSIAGDHTLSLSEIISKDAGGILAHANDSLNAHGTQPKVAAYYAQLYAFIRFLREDNYGQRYPQLRKILYHAYLGNHWPISTDLQKQAQQPRQTRQWNTLVGRQLFQSYIAPDPRQIEPAYQNFCRKIIRRLATKTPAS